MSLQKRRERAAAEAVLEKQKAEIRQTFKRDKLAKAMGELSAEQLFKPITKGLGDTTQAEAEPQPEVGPDYAMEEFDRINPLDWQEGFRPEATTPPSPVHTDEEDFEFLPPPSPVEEETPRQIWDETAPTKFLESYNESNDLRSLSSMITKMG